MRAAVLRELAEPLVIEDIPTPQPGPGEVLVQTKACGMCATDLHIHAGWGYQPELPFVMGHEPAGVVAEVGAGVSDIEPGDRVVPNIFYSCGMCRFCTAERETLCPELDGILGVLKHAGAYAEYFTIPARQLFRVPENVSFADAAVVADAVVTAVHAVRRRSGVTGRSADDTAGQASSGTQPDWVLVIGAGGVGQSVIQVARMAGANVLAADVDPAKIERAKAVGARDAALSADASFDDWMKEHTKGRGVDVVYDCHGSEQTLRDGLASLAPAGRLVIVGYTQETFSLSPQAMSRRELEIVGSRSGSRRDTREAIELVASDAWRSIVSDTYRLEAINEALELLKSGRARGRIAITLDEGEN